MKFSSAFIHDVLVLPLFMMILGIVCLVSDAKNQSEVHCHLVNNSESPEAFFTVMW